MKIKGATWFTGARGLVGIVWGELERGDDHGDAGPCAYIGAADGIDEEEDKKQIADWGARILPSHLSLLIRHFRISDCE